LITDTAQPLIRDLIFINNDARSSGGGLFAQSNLTLVSCQFISNTATEFGGSIYAIHDLTVTNSEFMSNYTTGAWPAYFPYGGGIYAQSNTLIRSSRFVGNSSNYGGALVNTGATLTLIDSDFSANSGGGVIAGIGDMITGYLHISGGHFSDHASSPALNAYRPTEISGTQFIRNSSGAARIYQSPAIIANSRFENNHCTECDAGGLYFYGSRNDGNVPLTLSNTVFINNSPGGAFIYQSSMITIVGSRFEHNFTPSYGGALWAYDSPLIMINTEVISNTAIDGPGGLTAHPTTVLIDSRIEGNASSGSYGGGLWTGELFLTNTNFINNSAAAGGGAMAWRAHLNGGRFERNTAQVYGGGLAASELYISGTVFVSNTAQLGGGGGALTYGATVLLDGKFENNRTLGTQNDVYGGNGGGLAVAAGPLQITGTEFINNSTGAVGGGLFYTEATDSRIVNALFAENTASIDGAAIAIDSMGQHEILQSTIAGSSPITKPAISVLTGTLYLTNTIIANHTVGISNTGGTVYEDYNLFFNTVANTVDVITGAHSLIGDPKFVDPLNGDYHLQFGSAAIDHGVDAGVYADLDGNPRPGGAGFDIGAYEYQSIKVLYLPLIYKH
jgi:predicted outer membrane repeat protein